MDHKQADAMVGRSAAPEETRPVPDRTDTGQLIALLPWIAGLLLLGVLPYLIAWALTPDGMQFTGALVNADDTGVYLSAIRQGINEHWLFHYYFSSEQINPQFLYLAYLALGHIARFVGGTTTAWFHGTRILFGGLTLLALWFWARHALPQGQAWTGWLLIIAGSGLGWLLAPIAAGGGFLLPDLAVPEWTVVTALLSAPHFIAGLGALALLMTALHALPDPGKARWPLPAAVAGSTLLALFYPYDIPVAGLVIGLYLLAHWRRPRPWRLWISGGIVLLPLSAMLIYYGWLIPHLDPLWRLTHVADNVVPSVPPPYLLTGYGLLALFAGVGLWRWLRARRDPLVPIWLIVNLIALYLPLPFAGRFTLGLIIPLGTLAAFGLEDWLIPTLDTWPGLAWFQRLTPTPRDTLRRVLLILCLPSTLLVSLWAGRSAAGTAAPPFYMPTADVEAAQWLAGEVGPEDLILSYYPMGNYFPRMADSYMFMGNQFLTVDLDGKLALVEQFWDPETSDSWRESLIDEWGVTLIYQGSYEGALSRNERITLPFEVIHETDDVTIYRVRAP